MIRLRLPDRRPAETAEAVIDGRRFTVTIGFYPDGRPGEVFADGARIGSDLDALLDDACVALSLLLQHGVDPLRLADSMGRAGDSRRPASLIGVMADLLAEVAQQDAPPDSPEGSWMRSGHTPATSGGIAPGLVSGLPGDSEGRCSGGIAMKLHPKGFGGERAPPETIKRDGWRSQGILLVSADDARLTWPERELVHQFGRKLYGDRKETNHG